MILREKVISGYGYQQRHSQQGSSEQSAPLDSEKFAKNWGKREKSRRFFCFAPPDKQGWLCYWISEKILINSYFILFSCKKACLKLSTLVSWRTRLFLLVNFLFIEFLESKLKLPWKSPLLTLTLCSILYICSRRILSLSVSFFENRCRIGGKLKIKCVTRRDCAQNHSISSFEMKKYKKTQLQTTCKSMQVLT